MRNKVRNGSSKIWTRVLVLGKNLSSLVLNFGLGECLPH